MAPSSTQGHQAEMLSHELRTPIQGIVGILDLMHYKLATAQSAPEHLHSRELLAGICEDIEAIQDSARRATEAADNIVRAGEMNMGQAFNNHAVDSIEAQILSCGSMLREDPVGKNGKNTGAPTLKRRCDESHYDYPPQTKTRASHVSSRSQTLSSPSVASSSATDDHLETDPLGICGIHGEGRHLRQGTPVCCPNFLQAFGVGLRMTNIRDVIERVVDQAVKVGSRPLVSRIAASGPGRGEQLDVETKANNGVATHIVLEWSIDGNVPECMLVDERSFAKAVTCVLQNAVKFTMEGLIFLRVSFEEDTSMIRIEITDTGPGISLDFQPDLFKAFAREENRTKRKTEGMGLGLMIAKTLVDKMGVPAQSVLVPSEARSHQNLLQRMPPAQDPSSLLHSLYQQTKYHAPLPQIRPGTLLSPEPARPSLVRKAQSDYNLAQDLASRYHPSILVSEDNAVNRKVLVSMLIRLGNQSAASIYEAVDGANAVRQVEASLAPKPVSLSASSDLSTPHSPKVIRFTPRIQQIKAVQEAYGYTDAAAAREPYKRPAHPPERPALFHAKTTPAPSGPPPGPFDLILMDLWMPNKDGLEACVEILQRYRNLATCANASLGPSFSTSDGKGAALLPNPPIILAVTADSTEGAAERAIGVGMQGVLLKPYGLRDLEKLLKSAWEARRGLGVES